MIASRTVCHRCGSTVARYELSLDKVNVATVDDFKLLALWCSTCSGILCPECAGVHIRENSILLGYGFCPVCKERTEPANEQQIKAPMSRSLKKAPPARGFFGKLFGQAQPAPGSFAYLFVVTQYKQPTDSQVANEYLLEVANMCAPGWTSAPPQSRSKMAALWETDAVDRGQLIAWASQAFGEEFKAMSTKYDLSFSRFEHRSGSGQVLVALHR
jgi:hypothetical protein